MNRVLAHTGARYPILQAPMGWIARSTLASAVSRASLGWGPRHSVIAAQAFAASAYWRWHRWAALRCAARHHPVPIQQH